MATATTIKKMPFRRAGQTGLYLPLCGVGLGRWGEPVPGCENTVGEREGFKILDRAFELGATHWDTASGYTAGNSERLVGKWFATRGRDLRDQVILSTKWHDSERGTGRGGLRKVVDGCLCRLQTDYLDIFMLHNPCMAPDGSYLAPLDETWGTLDDLVSQGKIHYLGISNANLTNVRDAVQTLERVGKDASRRLALVENAYNVIRRHQVGRGMWTHWQFGSTEPAFLHELATHGIGLVPFWPLAAGALGGRYRAATLKKTLKARPVTPAFQAEYLEGPTFAVIEQLGLMADRKGVTLAQLASAWLLAQPAVSSVISGVTSLAQLEDNTAAAFVQLSPDELAAMDALSRQVEHVDDFVKRFYAHG